MNNEPPKPDPDELLRIAQQEDPKRPPVIKDQPKKPGKKGEGK